MTLPLIQRGRSSSSSSRSRSRSRSSRGRRRSRGRSRSRSYSSSSYSSRYTSSRSRSYSPAPRRSRRRSISPRSRSRSRSYSPLPPRRRSPSPPASKTKLFINKLSKNVNQAHLFEIFGMYGKVLRVDVPVNRKLGCNRGIAYVDFESNEAAEKAIECMHGGQVDGNVISVTWSMPKPANVRKPMSRGGGGRKYSPVRRRYSRSRSPAPIKS